MSLTARSFFAQWLGARERCTEELVGTPAARSSRRGTVTFLSSETQQPGLRPSSGFFGVYADLSANHKRWTAQIAYDGKLHWIGSFHTKQQAALAYDRAARQYAPSTPLNYETLGAAEEA